MDMWCYGESECKDGKPIVTSDRRLQEINNDSEFMTCANDPKTCENIESEKKSINIGPIIWIIVLVLLLSLLLWAIRKILKGGLKLENGQKVNLLKPKEYPEALTVKYE